MDKVFALHVDSTSTWYLILNLPSVDCAAANAIAFTCGDQALARAEAEATAKAIASATAVAVSQIHANCTADNGAFACIEAETFIQQSASTVAEVRYAVFFCTYM